MGPCGEGETLHVEQVGVPLQDAERPPGHFLDLLFARHNHPLVERVHGAVQPGETAWLQSASGELALAHRRKVGGALFVARLLRREASL